MLHIRPTAGRRQDAQHRHRRSVDVRRPHSAADRDQYRGACRLPLRSLALDFPARQLPATARSRARQVDGPQCRIDLILSPPRRRPGTAELSDCSCRHVTAPASSRQLQGGPRAALQRPPPQITITVTRRRCHPPRRRRHSMIIQSVAATASISGATTPLQRPLRQPATRWSPVAGPFVCGTDHNVSRSLPRPTRWNAPVKYTLNVGPPSGTPVTLTVLPSVRAADSLQPVFPISNAPSIDLTT